MTKSDSRRPFRAAILNPSHRVVFGACYSLLIASLIVGVAVVLLRRNLLPARFFYDANQLHRLADPSRSSMDFSDPSYGGVAVVYRLLGLGHDETLAGLVTFAVAALVVYTALRLRDFSITLAGTVGGVLALVVGAVYLGTYSKDLLVLPIALVALRARVGWIGHAALIAAVLLYAHVFREYWVLTAALYLLYLLVMNTKLPAAAAFALPILVLVAVALVAYLGFGVESDFARTQVNELREGTPDARTAIAPFVDLPGAVGPMVNTVLTFLTLVVPVPMLLQGQSYYVFAALTFIVIWAVFVLGFIRTRRGSIGRRCGLLVLAFLTTQALFEPDYGSALRHVTPLLGLVVFIGLHTSSPWSAGSRRALMWETRGFNKRGGRSRAVRDRASEVTRATVKPASDVTDSEKALPHTAR